MKFSSRNQFFGKVASIRRGSVNAEVDLETSSGTTIVAQVTLPSLVHLELAPGKSVWALVKSSWILLGTGESEPKVSARNRLKGRVSMVSKGIVNAEVSLDLANGETITATITNASAEMLGLSTGTTAWALFKASAVILSVES